MDNKQDKGILEGNKHDLIKILKETSTTTIKTFMLISWVMIIGKVKIKHSNSTKYINEHIITFWK